MATRLYSTSAVNKDVSKMTGLISPERCLSIFSKTALKLAVLVVGTSAALSSVASAAAPSYQFSSAAYPTALVRRAQPMPGAQDTSTETFDQWLAAEMQISLTRLMTNVAPADTVAGVIVASPQRTNPDYYYHWVRDAALTMDMIARNTIALQQSGADSATTSRWVQLMTNYAAFSRANQLSPALTGLGEPKFNVDGGPYMADWGRPQNDGPALRARTLMRFARALLQQGQTAYVTSNLYDSVLPTHTVIKADLEYVAHHWNDPSFDLWEEVKGDHFYTRVVQLSSMLDGANFARQMNDSAAADFYAAQASAIQQSLESFWDPSAGFLRVTLNRIRGGDSKGGLDSAIILGVLHADLQSGEFTVMDSRVMATAERLREAFAPIYTINTLASAANLGTAIGRYPEDVYSGTFGINQGNPWVLATAAFAEYHYKLATAMAAVGSFSADSTNLAFLKQVLRQDSVQGRTLAAGLTFRKGSPEMNQLVASLKTRGDEYLMRVRLHENADGSLSEQMDRNSGYMTSARDLSWSYVSLITAGWARQ